MDFWRIVVSIILPPLGVFWEVGLPNCARNTNPFELRFRVLLNEASGRYD